MKQTKDGSSGNPFIALFSSVKLAVTLLIALAVTSIVGTVVPQGESFQFYLEHYGPFWYKVIRHLHLFDTYHAWWYIALLALFGLNLIVCIGRRLPFTIRLLRRDSLSISPEKLERMRLKARWELNRPAEEVRAELARDVEGLLGRHRVREGSNGVLFLKETGRWSYWGIYLLHASIVIIMVGALVGSIWGKKGNILLMEGDVADHFLAKQTMAHGREKVPLGFKLKCKRFVVKFYNNGAPKEFRSDLVVIDGGKEVKEKAIKVNDPLHYKGFTFYQASYQGIPQVTLQFVGADGSQMTETIPAYEQHLLKGVGVAYGIMQFVPNAHGMPAAKVWIGQFKGTPPQAFWLFKGHDRDVKIGGKPYKIAMLDVGQKYITGLQVKKDPSVWIVWIGCAGLILGFMVVFWVPHRRTWVWIGEDKGKTLVLAAGQSNKGKVAYEAVFKEVAEEIEKKLKERSWL